ncbi:uncharacterized protein F5891DRAFT_1241919 [Suillus fuscotomentosus]|uniref:Uncharacterized protein n=1 Tax=Suillus fuscotomentosus TaxID=1912939 RepID=A0AAD4HIB0_9AGAM|nr:uncharacterized protein F5891DRAFT_1241919 [Suillus fuscotomentosus]KAG1897537.1 hypothetical protein F5891DRAFT_1241919 [Suillus fuscotomentosus]
MYIQRKIDVSLLTLVNKVPRHQSFISSPRSLFLPTRYPQSDEDAAHGSPEKFSLSPSPSHHHRLHDPPLSSSHFLASIDHLPCPTVDDSIRRCLPPTSHIVKSDIARLVSRTQRYRNAAFAGEEECTRDLTQIATVRTTFPPDIPVDVPGSLRGRVEQGSDAIAGSTIKIISDVVDSSFNAIYSARSYHLPPP